MGGDGGHIGGSSAVPFIENRKDRVADTGSEQRVCMHAEIEDPIFRWFSCVGIHLEGYFNADLCVEGGRNLGLGVGLKSRRVLCGGY